MDTQNILDKVLSTDEVATEAYNSCLAESKQASLLANKKLNDLLEATKIEAQKEVAQMWEVSKAKVAQAMEQNRIKNSNQEKIDLAKQRMDDVVDRLIQILLTQKS
jgi:hypothetical protein